MSEGLQVLSSNSYQGEPLLRGATTRMTSLGETQVKRLSKKAATLGGRPHCALEVDETEDKWESKRRD